MKITMKIPFTWLKEFIGLEKTPEQLSKILTMAGLEVDGVEKVGPQFSNVVVGKVLETVKHPDADKLVVAQVSDGTETFQVVCGAPNCRAGIKVAFAKIGAVLHDDKGSFTIKKSKLRGVESSGMLCSATEIGLGSDGEGIMELSEALPEGTDLASVYSDVVFEISLTPNLGHCSSVLGVARELSAATHSPVRMPETRLTETSIATKPSVTIQDFNKCPRYAARFIQGVKVGPSPAWLQKRLEMAGLRSVNNVVDVTNYVMLELGHPLHAFDFDRIEGGAINVRAARDGERFITLDGKERDLNSEDLLIAGKNDALAIAGVMGGQNSEVTDETTRILLEAAYFAPASIRRTSKRLGLSTDSSKRFERGTDPNSLLRALDRAAMLIQELAGGEVANSVIDLKESAFLEKVVSCRLQRINSLLGTHLGISEVESIFKSLQMACKWNGRDAFVVSVPTYRVDVQSEIDLVEEVARIYGFDNIPRTAPKYHASTLPHSPIYLFENEIRRRLVAEGLQEFLTCDLIGPSNLAVVGDEVSESSVKVLNPNSIEQSILRTSLLPGLLQVVKYNEDHQNHDLSGFEIGRVHFRDGDKYHEESVAALILSGKNRPHFWDDKPRDVDFYDLKGIVENLLDQLGITNYTFRESTLQTFHTGRQAAVFVGALEIGSLGEIHPAVQRRLDVPQRILFAELSLHDLFPLRAADQRMVEISKYPASERDWTVSLKEETPVQQVLSTIEGVPSRLLEHVSLIDIYRSEKLGQGKKNVTFHFVYRDKERTIAQEAVDAEHARIINEVLKQME